MNEEVIIQIVNVVFSLVLVAAIGLSVLNYKKYNQLYLRNRTITALNYYFKNKKDIKKYIKEKNYNE
jgi:hypothetical protein